jgi:hypothetical protein
MTEQTEQEQAVRHAYVAWCNANEILFDMAGAERDDPAYVAAFEAAKQADTAFEAALLRGLAMPQASSRMHNVDMPLADPCSHCGHRPPAFGRRVTVYSQGNWRLAMSWFLRAGDGYRYLDLPPFDFVGHTIVAHCGWILTGVYAQRYLAARAARVEFWTLDDEALFVWAAHQTRQT